MAADGSPSVLERKLAAASAADRGTGRSALRALRLALARIAKKLYDLQLAVIGAKQTRCDHDGITRFLSDDHLLVLLDGADGLAGAASLDGSCVAALVQQQTMGQVTGNPMPDRAFTGTDAALAEPLIESLLARAAELSDDAEDQRCLSGFRFGARVDDARSLALALEADRFRVFELTVDIADGVMQGTMCLLLPDPPEDPDDSNKKGAAKGPKGPNLEQAIGVMRADLTAAICRLRLPLDELTAMQPGDVLPLVRERLEETELITIDGQTVAAGRLGQVNGLRALRLNETSVVEDLSEPPSQNGFGNRVVATQADANALVTLEGSVSPPQGQVDHAGLPVVIDSTPGADPLSDQASEPDDLFEQMTPQEAAAEITKLAGLTAEDTEA